MKTVFNSSNSKIILADSSYISEGGEGSIYVYNGLVYKIYHEGVEVISEAKVKELSIIENKNVLKPTAMVYDKNQLPTGFTMEYKSNTVPLPRLFTSSFRNRNSFTPEMAIKLIEKMTETIQHIHDKDIIMVDGNEFNYLIDGSTFIDPYFIDVDSYQTKSSPAKVIMPSIRDWRTKGFTKETDWFSFAIIACQILIGIHPFKGSHNNFKKNDMKTRIEKCVSIFNKDVRTPPSVRDFNLIPDELKQWFTELFEKGKRVLPPSIKGQIIVKPQITYMSSSNKFDIEEKKEFDDKIIGCEWILNNRITYTAKAIYMNNKKLSDNNLKSGIIFYENNSYLVDIKDGLSITDTNSNKEIANLKLNIDRLLIIDNRIYIIQNDKLIEIKIQKLGSNIIAFTGNIWSILPNSSHVFRKVIFSDVLGKAYLYIPHKENTCEIIQVPELKGYKILDAKYEKGICVVSAFNKVEKVYDRILIKFESDNKAYKFSIQSDVTPSGINFISLPNNIYLLLNGDDELEIGQRYKDGVKVLTNTKLGDISLFHNGLNVYYFYDKKVFSIKLK